MKDILKNVSKLSVPIGLNFLVNIIRNKLISTLIGPLGLGIYSQFINLSGFIYAILPIGSLGLIKYIARYHEENKTNEINYLLKYFYLKNVVFSIIAITFIIIFKEDLSTWLFSSSDFSNLLVLFFIFIPLNLILNFVDIYLKSTRIINLYVIFLSVNSLVSLICTIPLVYYWKIEGAIVAFMFTTIICLFSTYVILKKGKVNIDIKSVTAVDKSVVKNIYKVGIVSLISLAVQSVTFLLIRSLLADKYGFEGVGIFQCVYSLSAGYFGLFFVILGNYSIPKVSALKEVFEINIELNDTIKFLLLLYVPLVIIMFSFRSVLIPLLYSNEFITAKNLFIYQLPAEIFRAFSWVFGLWLIPKLKIKAWIIFELIFYSGFILLTVIFLNFTDFEIKSVSIAYLISYVGFFVLNFSYSVSNLEFKFSKNNIKLITGALILISVLFVSSEINEIWGYYLFIPVIIIWSFYSIKKHDLIRLKEIFRLK